MPLLYYACFEVPRHKAWLTHNNQTCMFSAISNTLRYRDLSKTYHETVAIGIYP